MSVILVEKTSKRIKISLLLSSCLVILGFVTVAMIPVLGCLMILVGSIWYLSARISKWWNHG